MGRLRIKSGSANPAGIELTTGVVTVGRHLDNTLSIADASVSGFHCEITVSEHGVTVKDRNSTNGTFVDGQQVTEATLQPGQTLRLGVVELEYEPAAAPRAAVAGVTPRPVVRIAAGRAPPAAGPPSAANAPETAVPAPVADDPPLAPRLAPALGLLLTDSDSPCRQHPRVAAEFICKQCRQLLCASCVKTRQGGTRTRWDCPTCRGPCVPLGEFQETERQREEKEAQTFFQRLPGAFGYPFGRGGTLLLVLGTMLFLVLDFAKFVARFAPGYGRIAMIILTVFSYGYLFAYMQKIVISTAQGEEHLPGWPEITEGWSDVTHPFLLFAETIAACFGPAIGYLIWTMVSDVDINLYVFAPLAGLGFLYFPMALLAVCMADSVVGVNPLVVLPAIVSMPLQYLTACFVLLLVLVMRFFSVEALHTIMPVPVLPTILVGFLALYFLVVEMRVLGLMYYSNRHRFGWLH